MGDPIYFFCSIGTKRRSRQTHTVCRTSENGTAQKMDIVNALVNIVFDRIKPIQLPEKDVKSVVVVSSY